jgi:NAD-dependent DNA ligase
LGNSAEILAERAQTHIKSISISVEEWGFNPIAELEPVNVGGVLVLVQHSQPG